MRNLIELLRASVRPVLTYVIIGVIMAIGVKLALRFADADLAKTIVVMILGSGTTVMGFWFGVRSALGK